MPNEELCKLLRQIAQKKALPDKWAQACGTITYIDLSHADFSHLDLSHLAFVGADFTGAKLFNTNFTAADLTRATMPYADLRRSNLANTNLEEVNLSAANLSGANMIETNLVKANLQGAVMSGVHLVGANLTDADLTRADLSSSNLKFSKFAGANMTEVNVEDADLSQAYLKEEHFAQLRNLNKAIQSKLREKARETTKRRRIAVDEDYEDLFPEEDCHRILGVEKDASLDDISRAYKQKVKEYHPDRVQNMGWKIKEVARREFERVQFAYESLSHHITKPNVELSIQVDKKDLVKPGAHLTIEQLINLSKRFPNNDKILYNLGNRYLEDNKVDQAAVAYKRALTVNPANEFAAYNLKIATLLSQLLSRRV